jgi:hemolysin activation/secretion protein
MFGHRLICDFSPWPVSARAGLGWVLVFSWGLGVALKLSGAEAGALQGALPASPTAYASAAAQRSVVPRFNVQAYAIEGNTGLSTNDPTALLSKHTGTNVALEDIVQAASVLQTEYRAQGYPAMCIAIAPAQIAHGVVTMHVYQGAFPQILVSGKCFLKSDQNAESAASMAPAKASPPPAVINAPASSAPPPLNQAHAARATNAEPHFAVLAYEVAGNTLLPKEVFGSVFLKYTGTNVSFTDITKAVKELQMEYRNRGYDTVTVTIPQQRLTNATFRLRVFEGRLAEIRVTGNHYYSSNNVTRALPGLTTNTILNSKLLQPELDRANANQDRQIYAEIRPGPDTETTTLVLRVKDRLPLHAKIEANNESPPSTPENRLNFSAVYNNLWQADHSVGVQYSYSPEDFKDGKEWNFYDRPLVANYSAFYRMPLSAPRSTADAVASHPGNFGYNEATRKFELPPASGIPEFNVYASRSTIDTGVQVGSLQRLSTSISGTIDQESVSQNLTVNEGLGFRFTEPLPEFGAIRSRIQGGLDFKSYTASSFATNNFIFTEFLLDTAGNPFTRVSTTPSPVPSTVQSLSYLPLAIRWDASRPDKHGSTDFGINYSPNLAYSDGQKNLQSIVGSSHANGYWHVVSGSLAREQTIRGDWKLALRADGQWASEPLISNEQFGVGGIAGVRGYRQGEVFGDTGWRVTSELKTPPYRVGNVGQGTSQPLTVRASTFMDYAQTYLLDPNGRAGFTPLWGTGVGVAASIGHTWEGRLLFAWPLLRTPNSEPGQLRITFDLSAQF